MSTVNVLIGTWTLKGDENSVASSTAAGLSTAGETSFANDHRTHVASDNYKKDAGKYRGIVKLQLQFENQSDSEWAMGSGWLVAPDLVITAGHCVYDWSNQLGKIRKVKAYIGYSGKDSTKGLKLNGDGAVQYRTGSRIATTSGWLSNQQNRTNDVAFIQLKTSFTLTTSFTPFSYIETPVTGSENLTVVGYPADKYITKNNTKEAGAEMWEESADVAYNLKNAYKHMLEYRISTYGGNSGSPVLRTNTRKSIGTHAYGGVARNSASPIAGLYGNPYKSFQTYFKDISKYPTVKTTKNNINYVAVPREEWTELSFSDALTVISHIATDVIPSILSAGSPFLGPVGGPLAALAGAVLGAAGSIGEMNMGAESTISTLKKSSYQGYYNRGLLAEAALQTYQEMPGKKIDGLKLRGEMELVYKTIAPGIFSVGPRLLPLLLEPGIRVGLNEYRKVDNKYAFLKKGGTESTKAVSRIILMHSNTESTTESSDETRFKKELWKDTIPVTGEESFVKNDLGNVIESAIDHRWTISTMAPTGLDFLTSILPSSASGEPLSGLDLDMHSLCLRAAVGEAALQALMKIDPQQLRPKEKGDPDYDPEERSDDTAENYYDMIKTMAQKMGKDVIKVAPKVLEKLMPVVIDLLKGEKVDLPKEVSASEGTGNKSKGKQSLRAAEPMQIGGSLYVNELKKRAAIGLIGIERDVATSQPTELQRQAQILEQEVNLDGVAFFDEED